METIYIRKDAQGRRGKKVIVLEGFTRRPEELEEVARKIKLTLGVGGTIKNSRIEIQGNFPEQIATLLQKIGFQVKLR